MASKKMGSKRAVKPAKKAAKKTVNTFFDRTRSFSFPSDEYSKNWEQVFGNTLRHVYKHEGAERLSREITHGEPIPESASFQRGRLSGYIVVLGGILEELPALVHETEHSAVAVKKKLRKLSTVGAFITQ